eukprot:TRINITY_DN91711_c0_g1_i1.p2 TRINITY_DN91711_c0_g1~~TRINITY_DN91711_c0_g1_i1.p2  ORF type:complete len:261 (+),score=80.75 TRINITY_DN91711_c0_g1_i1:74-856(+)
MEMDAAAAGLKRSAQTSGAASATKVTKTDHQDKGRKGNGKGKNREISDADIKSITLVLGKLTLVNSRELAMIKSAVVKTMLFNKEKAGHIVATLKQINKDYTSTVKSLSPSERSNWSSPHVFIWLELVTLMIKATQDHNDQHKLKQIKEVLKNHLKEVNELAANELKTSTAGKDLQTHTRNSVALMIKTAKLSTCWDPARMKLELSADASYTHAVGAMHAVLDYFKEAADGALKSGAAPKGDLERRLSALLDNGTNGTDV